jgi:capsule polysaccharide export protein KpsE/RkpR
MISMSSGLLEGLGLGASTSARSLSIRYSSIINSRTVSEETVNKFNLIEYLKIEEDDPQLAMDIAVKKLSKIKRVVINDENSFLRVRVTTYDKNLSQQMAQHYLDKIITYATQNTNNIGRQKRELLETRIEQITTEMLELVEEIKQYQKTHNVIEIEAQAKASIDGYSIILRELFDVDIQLRLSEIDLPGSTRTKDLRDRRQAIIDSMNKLEKDNSDTPFFLALRNINDNLFTIQEKIFGMELYRKILETIYPQLELARLEEIDNMDKVEIIDFPNIPGIRSFPQRTMICAATFMISFLFSSAMVVMRGCATEEDKAKLSLIWKSLFK